MKTQTQLFKSKGFAPLFRLRSDHKVVGLSDGRHGRLILRKEDWNMNYSGYRRGSGKYLQFSQL